MNLARSSKLLKLWRYTFNKEVNVILMRHAPKAGSDNSDLSEEGKRLTIEYGNVLRKEFRYKNPVLACTSKNRTGQTLKLLFPFSDPATYTRLSDLEVNKVSPFVQNQVNKIHKEIGRLRGYYLNHTYYFFDEENLHAAVAERMVRGIRSLFDLERLVIYCGHSPAIEVALEKLLGVSLTELGGFLNPLDSIHLRMTDRVEWIARINPIIDYTDLESETYF